jgi:hypothetical protein
MTSSATASAAPMADPPLAVGLHAAQYLRLAAVRHHAARLLGRVEVAGRLDLERVAGGERAADERREVRLAGGEGLRLGGH